MKVELFRVILLHRSVICTQQNLNYLSIEGRNKERGEGEGVKTMLTASYSCQPPVYLLPHHSDTQGYVHYFLRDIYGYQEDGDF